MRDRRWDIDERGHGVASGDAFAPGVDELRHAMADDGWVSEDPEAHLLSYIRKACEAEGSAVSLASAAVEDAVLLVELDWTGVVTAPDAARAEIFRVLGSFAEHSTHVRQRTLDGIVEFDVATGTLKDESPFKLHGHLVRIRVRTG